jgi:hypothetical protein
VLGGQVLHRADPARIEAFDHGVQQVHGGPGIGQGPVVRADARAHVRGKGTQSVVAHLVLAVDAPGELQRVHDRVARPGNGDPGGLGPQEADVETGVVGDQDRIVCEIQEGRQHGLDVRGTGDRGIGDPGQGGDVGRDGTLGVHEGTELAEHLAPAHLDRTDLGDGVPCRIRPGGLEVQDHHLGLGERGAEVLEGELAPPHEAAGGFGPE